MRRAIHWGRVVAAMLLAGSALACAQTPVSAASQPADLFDFWVGDWDLTWTNEDGTTGRGRNRIDKILDGAVVEEKFEELVAAGETALKGRSLTVRDKKSGIWRQSWADNQGGYFTLTTQVDGARRILTTEVVKTAEKASVQRMVFHSMSADALIWDWEGSADGGTTWKRLWRIDYRRRKAP
ncbi:MAG: hypothetical protein ABIS28_17765 [Caldimonas sp.]